MIKTVCNAISDRVIYNICNISVAGDSREHKKYLKGHHCNVAYPAWPMGLVSCNALA